VQPQTAKIHIWPKGPVSYLLLAKRASTYIVSCKVVYNSQHIYPYHPYSNNLLSRPLPVLVCQTVVCKNVNLKSLQGYTKPYNK